MLVNVSPATFAAVSSSTTVISTTICSPAGISIPIVVSSMTRFVSVPVLTGVQDAEPAILLTPTKRRSAAVRSSVIRTS